MDAYQILFGFDCGPVRYAKDEYITQRQAKAGGEESPVNGKFYEGGEFMPVHGHGPQKSKEKAKPKSTRKEFAVNHKNERVELPEDHRSIQSMLGVHPSQAMNRPDSYFDYIGLHPSQVKELVDMYNEGVVSIPREITQHKSKDSFRSRINAHKPAIDSETVHSILFGETKS